MTQNGAFIELPVNFIYFNTSITKLNDDCFLYAIRCNPQMNKHNVIPGVCALLMTDQVNPQNDMLWKADMFLVGINIKRGKNFWWRNWGLYIDDMTTIFVIGNHRKNEYMICNMITTHENPFFSERIFKSFGNDDRLIKYNDEIYIHSNNLNNIVKLNVDIENNTIYCTKMLSYFLNIDKLMLFGQNYGIVTINNKVIILDGFIHGNFSYHTIYLDNNNNVTRKLKTNKLFTHSDLHMKCVPYNNHTCNIENVMPIFSVGPAVIITIEDKKYILCVGHIKINYFFDHKMDNIREFIIKTKELMETKYKNTFCQHDRYIYTMCFYLCELNNNCQITNITMSKSILPVFSSFNKDYNFSLFFPMGIEICDDTVIVTGGYGDYYSVVIELEFNDVINMCEYNIKEFDFEKYNYDFSEI